MPTYRYQCATHGEFERWQSITVDTIPPCPESSDCAPPVKVFSVPRLSVWATPNKGGQAKYAIDRESRFDKDGPAYKRLRQDGLQPRGIDRASRVEAGADTRLEVEMGKRIPKERRSEALELNQELRENQRRPEVTEQVGEVVRGKRREVEV